jgi:hypothetical protein
VLGDDEFGRCSELRERLRLWKLKYVLDVPCNTLVRDPSERRPPSSPQGSPRRPLFERVDQWVDRQAKGRWRTVTVRDGEKGPLQVKVLLATVQTKDEAGRVGPRERLVVLRSVEAQPRTWYTLSNEHEAGRAAHVLRGHEAALRGFTINPRGDRIVSAAVDGSLRAWGLTPGGAAGPSGPLGWGRVIRGARPAGGVPVSGADCEGATSAFIFTTRMRSFARTATCAAMSWALRPVRWRIVSTIAATIATSSITAASSKGYR